MDLSSSELKELLEAFEAIQMPRPPFVLEKFVVGAQFTIEQQYAQCVLEMSVAYDNLRIAQLKCQKSRLEIDALPDSEIGRIDKQIKEIELEQTRRAMLGAEREFKCLLELWRKFPRKYTREDLNAAQPEEFRRKLLTQASQDITMMGKIAQGNQEALRQAGLSVPTSAAQLPDRVEERFLLQGRSEEQLDRTEVEYLSKGVVRILIATPSASQVRPDRVECQTGIILPTGAEVKQFCCYGRPVDEAYTFIVRQAMLDKATYLFTVEDDTFPPSSVLVQLLNLVKDNPRCCVGAYYTKRSIPREGTHIVINGTNERGPMIDDGTVKEAYTLAMGCTLYPMQVFYDVPEPWFRTTSRLSQDSYFSQKARDAGWRLLVDTSIRCKHVDRETGVVYE